MDIKTHTSLIGKFIVVEGRDGVGKTTLVRNLETLLKSLRVPTKTIGFPDRNTPTGRLLDDYLQKRKTLKHPHTIHMLFSANRTECVMENINNNFDVCIIADRYTLSGYVYSRIAVGIEFAKILQKCEKQIGLREPDITIILDRHEATQGDELYETIDFQRKVTDLFRDSPGIIVNVDGMTEEQVLGEVFKKIVQQLC